jgi:predicted alpha/beta-fold hydrolase
MELSAKGGHVGFISGSKDNWLEKRIVDHLIA